MRNRAEFYNFIKNCNENRLTAQFYKIEILYIYVSDNQDITNTHYKIYFLTNTH